MRDHAAIKQCDEADAQVHMMCAPFRSQCAQTTDAPDSTSLPYLETRQWIADNLETKDAQQLDRLMLGLSTGWSYSLARECTENMAEQPLSLALQAIKHYLTTGRGSTSGNVDNASDSRAIGIDGGIA